MGGNVFKDAVTGESLTTRISKADVPSTVYWLELLTKIRPYPDHLTANLLGTSGVAETSGDLDIAIPKHIDKAVLVERLTDWVKHYHPDDPIKSWIAKTGISVHFRTPIMGNQDLGYVQTDFMFGDVEWLKWSLRGETEYGLKGRHRHILLASIAKARGFRWSPNNGVMTRNTGIVLTNQPDAVASYLLGLDASKDNLDSVPSIMQYITQLPNWQSLITEAEEAFSHEGFSIIEVFNGKSG